jgi:hypothetical protein
VSTSATVLKMPRFGSNQRVKFIGGEGIVKKVQHESASWNYLVEMEMGIEPDFGRVGAETMIVLSEADVHIV